MSMYKYVREAWKKPRDSSLWKPRLIQWRKDPVTLRIRRPTRIDRARSLGYRAKPGFIIVRQRVLRGGRKRPTIRAGRRSKHFGQRKDLDLNYQTVAERRAVQPYPNCEVLNSYYVGDDGKNIWYEAILVDRAHPAIVNDHKIGWIAKHRGRVNRGLTSAGKASRGLRTKGKGAEKLRPSRTAVYRRKSS